MIVNKLELIVNQAKSLVMMLSRAGRPDFKEEAGHVYYWKGRERVKESANKQFAGLLAGRVRANLMWSSLCLVQNIWNSKVENKNVFTFAENIHSPVKLGAQKYIMASKYTILYFSSVSFSVQSWNR